MNGKRRHASALVNINGFVGRGSEAVDLNAIPASMIDHIEILRDGAAAQYGSDAIAGVINIVLKSNGAGRRHGAGRRVFDEGAAGRQLHVGDVQARRQALLRQRRSRLAVRPERLRLPRRRGARSRLHEPRGAGYPSSVLSKLAPSDPNLPVPGGIDFKIGDSYQHDDLGWLNAGTSFANGMQLYAFGGLRIASATRSDSGGVRVTRTTSLPFTRTATCLRSSRWSGMARASPA